MITPADVFVLAVELADRDDEAALRASISRSYYATFLHLRALLTESGANPGRGSASHAAVRLALANVDESAANDLGALRLARNLADYDLDARINAGDAELALELARVLRALTF